MPKYLLSNSRQVFWNVQRRVVMNDFYQENSTNSIKLTAEIFQNFNKKTKKRATLEPAFLPLSLFRWIQNI